MPEFSTLAAVDLGSGVFGSGITCSGRITCGGSRAPVLGDVMMLVRRLASAERAQAEIDRVRSTGD